MRPPHLPTIEIKGHFLKNPFVVLPYATPITNPVGRVTPELLMHYKALARSEAALVITGPATVTTPPTRKASLLRIDQPKYLDGLRALIKIISTNGALSGVQLEHTGDGKIEPIQDATLSKFNTKLGKIDADKIHSAYRNAALRACEVGFKYVEINASGFGYFHQLCHEQHRELVHGIFQTVADHLDADVIYGLRLSNQLDNLQDWIDLFLQSKGDLIAGSFDGDSQLDKNHYFLELTEMVEPEQLGKLLKRSHLIGLPFNFQHKNRQVLQFYQLK